MGHLAFENQSIDTVKVKGEPVGRCTLSTLSEQRVSVCPAKPIDLPRPHWKILNANQDAMGQGLVHLADGAKPPFANNTCGDMMPIVSSDVRPRRNSRKRFRQPQGKALDPILGVYEVVRVGTVDFAKPSGYRKGNRKTSEEAAIIPLVEHVALRRTERVDLQALKERHEDAVTAGIVNEDSSCDQHSAPPLQLRAKVAPRRYTSGVKDIVKQEDPESPFEYGQDATSEDGDGNGWETCSSHGEKP